MMYLKLIKRNEVDYTVAPYGDEKNKDLFRMNVDPFPSQDFNINEHGFIRNDISAALQAVSQADFDARVARLQEISEKSSDLSDEELFDNIIPRYFQTPSDLIRFSEYKYSRQNTNSTLDSVSEEVSENVEEVVESEK